MGLFELIYYIGYRAKTFYDIGKRRKLPAKVISIGNITTGGAGKTPATIAVAKEADKRGLVPCVLTRGYKGRAAGPLLVTRKMKASEVGDEPLLMAFKLENTAIIKGSNRYESGLYAIHKSLRPPDLFILDDGYQHRRLHRDVDVLLVDSQDPFDNGRLLPMGLLREPLRQIKRADVIVLTKCLGQDNGELIELLRKYNPTAPVFEAEHMPAGVKTLSGSTVPLSMLTGKKVYAFCAIAAPEHFKQTLERCGVDLRGFREFRDHHMFTPADMEDIERETAKSGAEWIITTEKDIMRLKETMEGLPLDLVALELGFKVTDEFYNLVFGFRAS